MIRDKKLLAIIPARGGSKAIPGKNIKKLNGKPLIAWTIKAARDSRYIDKIVVSTDDEAIKAVAKKHGAEAPFRRPGALASDSAKMMGVILHCIRFFQKTGEHYDIIILLQPTSPLRNRHDIDKAIEYFAEKNAQTVISVTECEHSPQWAGILPCDHNMKNFIPKNIRNKNRQELKIFYRMNGAIYIAEVKHLINRKSFFGDRTHAYIMPRERSVDIDDIIDFKFAEFLIQHRFKE